MDGGPQLPTSSSKAGVAMASADHSADTNPGPLWVMVPSVKQPLGGEPTALELPSLQRTGFGRIHNPGVKAAFAEAGPGPALALHTAQHRVPRTQKHSAPHHPGAPTGAVEGASQGLKGVILAWQHSS